MRRNTARNAHVKPCPVPPLEPGQRAVYGLKPRTDPEHGFACQGIEELPVGDKPVAFIRAQLREYRYVLVFGWDSGLVGIDRRVEPDGYRIVAPVAREDRARVRSAVRERVGGDDPIEFW